MVLVIAVLGGGLTGLAVGYYLRDFPVHIYEKEQIPGGLCRSCVQDGFTFDFTGHLLHVRDNRIRDFVESMVGCGLHSIDRDAAVYSHGKYLHYPFQANLHGLPPEVVLECVEGFIQAYCAGGQAGPGLSFKQWLRARFGAGMCRHFFVPYNSKLWKSDLDTLTVEWTDRSVPRPSITEVLRGALNMPNTGMGYNARFFYPRTGGIGSLVDGIAREVSPSLCCGKNAASLNLKKRRISFADGKSIHYDHLVSTVPLPELVSMIEDIPEQWKKIAAELSFVSVHNINIGIGRSSVTPFHWIYFPEPEYPFYRVGCYSHFSTAMAPPGTSSLYIEVSALPEQQIDFDPLWKKCRAALYECGILFPDDRIATVHYEKIPYAYVVYNVFREKNLPPLLSYLHGCNVHCAGRYGSWIYASMEDCLIQAGGVAGRIRKSTTSF
jgi:protoporphyrinogen oxidase